MFYPLDENMESWRAVWRVAAPMLPTAGLEALEKALANDDPRLLQGATTTPPPLQGVQDWPVEAACLLGYPAWMNGLGSVLEVGEAFGRLCYDIDQKLQEAAGCRFLLNWYDETPRDEMIRKMLPEVRLELQRRETEEAKCPQS